MRDEAEIDRFWRDYLATLPQANRPDTYTAWSFGDNPALASELASLVLEGKKTATCGALWEYEASDQPLPTAGELSVILDGEDKPVCVIETVDVTIRSYRDVDEQFAFDEGEGDRSLSYWRETHWRYFSRTLAKLERQPSDTMPLVCERFRRVYP